jgi:O-antigen/teichoic acid export membrane protein
MGIVIRQSIKGTAVVYFGVILAFFLNLFIFPLCFTPKEVGLLRVLAELGVLISAFTSLGIQSSVIKFFPYFQDKEKKHNGFLTLISVVPLIGITIFTLLFYAFEDVFISIYQDDSPLLASYSYLIVPIAFGMMFVTIYEIYSAANLRIVVPKIFKEVFVRVVVIGFALIYFYGWVTFNLFAWVYVLIYIVVALMLLIYLKRLGQLYFSKIKFPQPELPKEMTTFNGFLLLGGIGGMLVYNVDIFLIGTYPDGDANNGIYLTAVLMASMIELPGRNINLITSPIIADHMKTNKLGEIQKLYKDSSIAQLSVACLLFTLLWCNIDNIYDIMPNGDKYKGGKYCLLFVGIGQLFNMVTSVNGTILGLSKHYKYGFYFMLAVGLISLLVNYLLIDRYSIIGASIARAFNILLYQITVSYFLYLKLKLNPLSNKTFLPVLIMALSLGVSLAMPQVVNEYVDIVLRSIVIVVIFVGLSLKLNVSPYFQELLNKGLAFLKLKK